LVTLSDASVLLDGQMADSAAEFQAEFGVVERDEVPQRVAREVGRLPGPAYEPSDVARYVDIPDVGMFFDWRWELKQPVEAADAEGVLLCLQTAVERTSTLSFAIKLSTFGDNS
jgi:hypothetical protein